MISFHHNIAAIERQLTRLARDQLPFASALALNDAALDVVASERRAVHRSFDRPTPFTLNAFYVRRASKGRQVAVVGVKPRQREYLGLQVEGGVRYPARRALLVPKGQRLNRYGNIPRGAVRRALARDDTFSGTIGGTAGVWRRRRGRKGRRGSAAPTLLVAFIPSASYRPRFDFQGGARAEALARFPIHFDRRLRQAIATAR